MKNKKHNHKHFHQYVEALLRHKLSVVVVLALMFTGVATFDSRMRGVMQQAYAEGWDWIGTYLHHEHPMHSHNTGGMARTPTTSGPGPS